MELAGLGSIPPYALYCYMSNEAYTTCAIYCLGAMRWQITAQRLCVLEHRPLLSELLYDRTNLKREENKAIESKVEITNTSNAEKDQHTQLVDFQAAEGSFRQPTAAEVSVLTFWKLRYARSRTQELSNEFARLLNRGSSLE